MREMRDRRGKYSFPDKAAKTKRGQSVVKAAEDGQEQAGLRDFPAILAKNIDKSGFSRYTTT